MSICDLQDFFLEFSKNGPCILSRSVLQLLYINHGNLVLGNIPFVDVLREAARSFISPPALVKSPFSLNSQVLYGQFFCIPCTLHVVIFRQNYM